MSPQNSRRMAAAIERLAKLYPDWRFGQIVANVATWAKGPDPGAVWDVDDDAFLRAAEEHLAKHSTATSRDRPRRKAI